MQQVRWSQGVVRLCTPHDMHSLTMLWFAGVGHVDCLAFALKNGRRPSDSVFEGAMSRRQVACVELLVSHGSPREPYFGALITCSDLICVETMCQQPKPVGPDVLRCLQHLFDNGRHIHKGRSSWQQQVGMSSLCAFCTAEVCLSGITCGTKRSMTTIPTGFVGCVPVTINDGVPKKRSSTSHSSKIRPISWSNHCSTGGSWVPHCLLQ